MRPVTDDPILVKRYARRRLYDTWSARYVTIDDLKDWRAKDIRFVVVDSETNDDITRILMA